MQGYPDFKGSRGLVVSIIVLLSSGDFGKVVQLLEQIHVVLGKANLAGIAFQWEVIVRFILSNTHRQFTTLAMDKS